MVVDDDDVLVLAVAAALLTYTVKTIVTESSYAVDQVDVLDGLGR